MQFWEELEDYKFNDNEYLVDHLVEVIKDEGINSLEELKNYEQKYFIESNMSREEWINWYENSFNDMPEIDNMTNDEIAKKIKQLREEITNTLDNNLKIRNIIMICALTEREFCFLVEAYNLIVDGEVTSYDENANNEESSEEVKVINNTNDTDNKINVVLCGSMKVKDEILRVADELKMMGYNPLLPEECLRGEAKAIASRAHFNRITNENNEYILIVNVTKEGIENYIGPNSFAEIAMAFYYNKNVILLNGIYEPYKDELVGWGVISLAGYLDNIKRVLPNGKI